MKHDPIATWKNMTTEEALARWKDGEIVWSVSMGGLGPGYEQCIQILAFTILEYVTRHEPDWERGDKDEEYGRQIVTEIEADPQVLHAVTELGPTGAQFGAALNMAMVVARQGYAKAIEMADEDRRIQVMRTFPTLTPRPEAP